MKGRERPQPAAVEATEEDWSHEDDPVIISPPLSPCVAVSTTPAAVISSTSSPETSRGPVFLGVVVIFAKGFFTGDGVTQLVLVELRSSADVGEVSWSSLEIGLESLPRLIFFAVEPV